MHLKLLQKEWFKKQQNQVSGTITVVERRADDPERATDRNNKQAIFKNYTPFSDWITVYRLYSD